MDNDFEVCGKRPGHTNSRYFKVGDDEVGLWVCVLCEQEAESEFYAEDLVVNDYRPRSAPDIDWA